MSQHIPEWSREFPQALDPLYHMQSPNVPITLWEGELELLRAGQLLFAALGSVELRWLPRPAIWFAIPELPEVLDLPGIEINIPQFNEPYEAMITNVNLGSHITASCKR